MATKDRKPHPIDKGAEEARVKDSQHQLHLLEAHGLEYDEDTKTVHMTLSFLDALMKDAIRLTASSLSREISEVLMNRKDDLMTRISAVDTILALSKIGILHQSIRGLERRIT